ncbi:hypothetical protein M3J09_009105 [Ascochyta lentis]
MLDVVLSLSSRHPEFLIALCGILSFSDLNLCSQLLFFAVLLIMHRNTSQSRLLPTCWGYRTR